MITSQGNARIRNVVSLRKKSKERTAQDVFLVEGIRMFREIPPELLVEAFVSESFEKRGDMPQLPEGISCETVADAVFEKMADTMTPQGVIGIVRQRHYQPDDLLGSRQPGSEAPLLLILENIQDPGNLGTILRSAEGAGVTGILMSRDCVDIYNPKVIRSTMGSVFRVPFCYTADLHSILREWKKKGISLFAAHLEGSKNYTEEVYAGPCGFLIGNEGNGLTRETADLADRYIRIPMKGNVESLNASVAASLLVYEAMRQRGSEGSAQPLK